MQYQPLDVTKFNCRTTSSFFSKTLSLLQILSKLPRGICSSPRENLWHVQTYLSTLCTLSPTLISGSNDNACWMYWYYNVFYETWHICAGCCLGSCEILSCWSSQDRRKYLLWASNRAVDPRNTFLCKAAVCIASFNMVWSSELEYKGSLANETIRFTIFGDFGRVEYAKQRRKQIECSA